MDVFDEEYVFAEQNPAPEQDTNNHSPEMYKKWFRTRDRSGFLSIRPWTEKNKCAIDIGELNGTGKMQSHTLVWTEMIALATYLRAVAQGSASTIYPANARAGVATNEGFTTYGGGRVDGKPVSRILKVHYWQNGTGENATFDPTSFAWKCGHFEARESASGAYIPDMTKGVSQNLIKVSRAEMAEMAYRLDLELQAGIIRNPNFFADFKR